MGASLHVGNLSCNVTGSDLERLFSQCGMVMSALIVSDRMTGRSKGFGFVEMKSDAEAQTAIKTMNLKEHDGRCMTVSAARPPTKRSGGNRGGGRGRGGRGY